MGSYDKKWHRNYNATQKRLELKERAIALLGEKCCLCGYNRCPAALEFHHLDPKEKDLVISRSMSWKRIEVELKKCELLCSNCHKEVHAGYHTGHLVAEDDFGYLEF